MHSLFIILEPHYFIIPSTFLVSPFLLHHPRAFHSWKLPKVFLHWLSQGIFLFYSHSLLLPDFPPYLFTIDPFLTSLVTLFLLFLLVGSCLFWLSKFQFLPHWRKTLPSNGNMCKLIYWVEMYMFVIWILYNSKILSSSGILFANTGLGKLALPGWLFSLTIPPLAGVLWYLQGSTTHSLKTLHPYYFSVHCFGTVPLSNFSGACDTFS